MPSRVHWMYTVFPVQGLWKKQDLGSWRLYDMHPASIFWPFKFIWYISALELSCGMAVSFSSVEERGSIFKPRGARKNQWLNINLQIGRQAERAIKIYFTSNLCSCRHHYSRAASLFSTRHSIDVKVHCFSYTIYGAPYASCCTWDWAPWIASNFVEKSFIPDDASWSGLEEWHCGRCECCLKLDGQFCEFKTRMYFYLEINALLVEILR